MAKRKAKHVGSCGMYVFVYQSDSEVWLLCHRRSKHMTEAKTIAPHGGIVERTSCGPDGEDFELGARTSAIKELWEESGIKLDEDVVLIEMAVDDRKAWWKNCHRNFAVIFDDFVEVPGPHKDHAFEMMEEGMQGIGQDAGDNYHAWVEVASLLSRPDLLPNCRLPLQQFMESGLDDLPRLSPFDVQAVEEEPEEPEAKRQRREETLDVQSGGSTPSAPPRTLAVERAGAAAGHDALLAYLQSRSRLPQVAIFDLDDTVWKGALDAKPLRVPPFSWCDTRCSVVDSKGTPVVVARDLETILLALYNAGVQLAVASHNGSRDWCCQVMDCFPLGNSGLTWGEVVPDELRVISWSGKHWPGKGQHLKDIREKFPGGPCEFQDMIFFDDGKKVIAEAWKLGAVGVRCQDELISVKHVKEAVGYLT
eukprot:TRINITY_DN17071_c0_g1_i1.p1 TRINITY_DN17071_c0_g1~~TRINITY_DN17071_c0_g1_i1.p1  ORF type:complete len:422 (-),score=67.14 TRINITY_DN17071_c0_g1_i1:8-1273(-)